MGADLVVLTQNVLGKGPGWTARRHLLARRMRALAPDVIGLQEVHAPSVEAAASGTSQAHELARLIGEGDGPSYHVDYAPGRVWPNGACEGVALLCKRGIRERAVHALTLDRADFLEREAQRVVLGATLDLGDTAVDVFVTHLSLSRRARTRTVKELMSFTSNERHRSKSVGAVLMGDLNAAPGEECIELLCRHWDDAWGGRRGGSTWPAPVPFRRLDYVFVQPKDEWTIQPRREPITGGSDHRGVLARVCLR